MCLVTSAKERNKAGRGLGETVGEGGCKFSVPPPPTHTQREHRGMEGSGNGLWCSQGEMTHDA